MTSDSPQKHAARLFLGLVTAGKIRDAYDQYVHADFIHHNQYYKGDRETLLKGMEESHVNFPKKIFTISKILEEGDTVMTFSSIKLSKEVPEMAVMHMMRFVDGKIAEMWDVGQQIDGESPNENGAF